MSGAQVVVLHRCRRRFAVGDVVQCTDGRSGVIKALTGDMFYQVQTGGFSYVHQHDRELLPHIPIPTSASLPDRTAQRLTYCGIERRAA